ncbi:metal ABC transporter permease [Longirhabdus pacifica]|uniref:metal ABC transporter permease n=1 Tax=Longirhabdus pacifica TaxID=2305227 RepID=UPI001008D68E|nr:metal ABC transporter permease [Longirhabdus pacifica]
MTWFEILKEPNIQWILWACTLLGIGSGVIGSFAYLRKQSLMGDALAHVALPGVCIAFLLSGVKSIFLFMLGAMVMGIISTFIMSYITRKSRIKQDTAIAIILSVFFGLGIVLLTYIQHNANGNQSGLDKFLFGQAATMIRSDVIVMAIISAILIVICTLFFKEFKLASFDAGFAKGLGYPVALIEQLIMFLIVIAVVVGIQAVGVVLMSALLITPAVSARYWTEKLGLMVFLSGLFGGVSGVIGTIISASGNNLPSGPLVVLSATGIFVFSILFAPSRGVVSKFLLRQSVKRKVEKEKQMQLRERGSSI